MRSAHRLASAALAGVAALAVTVPGSVTTAAAAATTQGSAAHEMYGTVVGPDGDSWSGVTVTVTVAGTGTVVATAASDESGYFQQVASFPIGKTLHIVYHDPQGRVPDMTYQGGDYAVAADWPYKMCLGTANLTYGLAKNTAAPTIHGIARVGQTLTADPGSWDPATGLSFDYDWHYPGSRSSLGYGRSHYVYPAEVGKTIQLTVSASSLTWSEGAASASVTIGKAIARVTALDPTTPVHSRHRFRVTTKVTQHLRQEPPMGTVRVFDGRHLVGMDYVGPGDGGRGRVSVTPLPVGRHKLTVRWPATSDTTAAKTSLTVTVRR